MRVFNVSTMLGRPEREQRLVWTQSDVPAPAGTISVDWIPEAPSLLKRMPLTQQLRQLGDIHRDPPRLTASAAKRSAMASTSWDE